MSQNLLTLGSQTNSNHHVPVGGQVNPAELDALISTVSSAINWDMLPNAESVKLTDSPSCYFVDEEGQDWEWDEPWEQTAVAVGPTSVTIIFVHSHSGHELFFTYERTEAAQAPAFTSYLDEEKENAARDSVKTLDDLKEFAKEWGLGEQINSATDFVHISDFAFQTARTAYVITKQALRDYINDKNNHDTPINEKRHAEHGWDNIATIEDVQLVLENEGFEYGILHKSSFLGVDDAKFHALKSEFEDAHYALNDAVGIEYTRTATKAFVPM